MRADQYSTISKGILIDAPTASVEALKIQTPRNDAISTGLAYINITDSVAPFSALTIDHNGTGKLIEFRDGGTLSGVVFKKANELCIGVHDTNIRFLDSSDSIIPVHSAGDGRNDSISLGTNAAKFKNGYFSGSLYGDGSNLTGVGGSTSFGAVGTYTAASAGTALVSSGSTVSGSTLKTNQYSTTHKRPLTHEWNASENNSLGVSGTWRNMTGDAVGTQFNKQVNCLWVRIS